MLYLYTVDVQDFDLEIYELEENCGEYAAICRKNNFYSFGSEERLVREFKEFIDNKLAQQNLIKNLEKKVDELVEEVVHLKKRLGQKEATVIIELNEEEPFDKEAYDYYTNNEIPVTCEEDMWHNLEVRHRKLQREIKAKNSTK